MLSWNRLVSLADAELTDHDLAAINLACAAGLQGAEPLDVEHCLNVLDGWAEHVRRETVRCGGQFERDPAAFENSFRKRGYAIKLPGGAVRR